jgi:hypothetical protein
MKKEIRMTKVNSTNLDSIGYEKKKKELQVEFKDGARYKFKDVKPDLFKEFQKAESKGSFFAMNIRNKFVTKKIKEKRIEVITAKL